ncbi:MAG: hypothetical protein HZB26_26360 [Candidatus Hydrogenedentes bacterium]|nr:hypothetical protein [Candidatus Hydrogenedentota bacterium]
MSTVYSRVKTVPGRIALCTLGLPILLNDLLRRLFRALAGPDWSDAGYRLATAFIGAGGLALFEAPIAARWLRWVARIAAWLMCLIGLAWFALPPWTGLGCGFLALFLIPYLRQGARLRAAPLQQPEPASWVGRRLTFRLEPLDAVSLGIVFLMTVAIVAFRRNLYPMIPDGYYHATVAREILRGGAIPLWDWWEFAPFGRPHLYPPLIHILVAALSLPYGGDVLEGTRLLPVILAPSAYLTTWYLARWLFDARRGFLALLIVGFDSTFFTPTFQGLPSILANAFIALFVVFFLSKRLWASAVMLALALYTHMGLPPLAVLGMFFFSVWRREYFRFLLGLTALAVILALPWYSHVWTYRAWFGHPMRDATPAGWFSPAVIPVLKLLWLLDINLVFAMLVVRARTLIPWSETRYKVLLCQIAGFLPMFAEYGGRFFMHTAPMWSVFAAVPLARFLERPLRLKKVPLFLLLALCPTLFLHAENGLPKYRLAPSGWMFAPIILVGGNDRILGQATGPISGAEAQELARFIKGASSPTQTLHFFGDAALGGAIGFFADRPIDAGAWHEVRQEDTLQLIESTAGDDPTGCYISVDRSKIPEDTAITQIGRFFVGVRGAGASPTGQTAPVPQP